MQRHPIMSHHRRPKSSPSPPSPSSRSSSPNRHLFLLRPLLTILVPLIILPSFYLLTVTSSSYSILSLFSSIPLVLLLFPVRARFILPLIFLPFFYPLLTSSSSTLISLLSSFLLVSLLLPPLRWPLFPFSSPLLSIKRFLSSVPLAPPFLTGWLVDLLTHRRNHRQSRYSGPWIQLYSNSDVFEGDFDEGKCSGSGVYYFCMGGRYEGEWIDDRYDGYGVETFAKGSRYTGHFKRGLRHGFGVYRFHTGDVYAGEWSDGQSHGCGVHTSNDGSRYVGEFRGGVKHGYGHHRFRNGDTYAGQYVADNMHGFGVYKFWNGDVYEGSWHAGKRQGLGIHTFQNGETQCGWWQCGVVLISSTRNFKITIPSPSSPIAAVSHSEVLHAVQDARAAAEEAFRLPKVDFSVKKSVIAANKAADSARAAAVEAVHVHFPANTTPTYNPISLV